MHVLILFGWHIWPFSFRGLLQIFLFKKHNFLEIFFTGKISSSVLYFELFVNVVNIFAKKNKKLL